MNEKQKKVFEMLLEPIISKELPQATNDVKPVLDKLMESLSGSSTPLNQMLKLIILREIINNAYESHKDYDLKDLNQFINHEKAKELGISECFVELVEKIAKEKINIISIYNDPAEEK